VDELVATFQRREVRQFANVRSIERSFVAKNGIGMFTEGGWIVRNMVAEMDSRFDEVNVLTNVVRH